MVTDWEQIPVRMLPGVGPVKEKHLAQLGIATVADLLRHFPFRYEDRSLTQLEETPLERATVQAVVKRPPSVRYKNRLAIVTAFLEVEQEPPRTIRGIWFNQSYLRNVAVGTRFLLTGRWDPRRNTLTVVHTEKMTEPLRDEHRHIVPVYRANAFIRPKEIRSLVKKALALYGESVQDPLPASLRKKYRLMDRSTALVQIHFPKNLAAYKAARRRLVFEEFFLFQLRLSAFRLAWREKRQGISQYLDAATWSDVLGKLPFALTEAQKKALREITDDMAAPRPMHRLLQGDVGSGKTIVALLAAYVAVRAGHQAAFLAPTGILATQHAQEARNLFAGLGVPVFLLTGGATRRERQEVKQFLSAGVPCLVIGTHAVLEDDLVFADLSLVITDEQHRFGVAQRAALWAKGRHPDMLAMSATPIPRTLAMTLYGDMDISVIAQMPAGRQTVKTFLVPPAKWDRMIRFLRGELARGRQAYVVAPRVEESDPGDGVRDAESLFRQLQVELSGFSVGLLHGKMSGTEKDLAMKRFLDRQTAVLVSTTVIEVGVNVPNATVMIIVHADRFGLAQLHQLRGRVGRGSHPSYCFLVAEPVTDIAKERLNAVVHSRDGFALAEKDLALRGAGELTGVRQSGLPSFAIGDLVEDAAIMKEAREAVADLVRSPDLWALPSYRALAAIAKPEWLA